MYFVYFPILFYLCCPYYSTIADCTSYYMCDAGLNPVLMNCPDGLFWDSNLNVCNWPENVECEQSGESSSSESVECEEGNTECELDSSSSSSSSSSEEGEEEELGIQLKEMRK